MPAFCPKNERLIPLERDLDKEVVSFVTCLRVSVLVGIKSTIHKYLPYRVTMQFGMDQDIPGCVPRFHGSKEFAWKNYCRPISDSKLYFPARLFEGDVTTRYAKWWNQSVLLNQQDLAKNIVQGKRSPRSLEKMVMMLMFLLVCLPNLVAQCILENSMMMLQMLGNIVVMLMCLLIFFSNA